MKNYDLFLGENIPPDMCQLLSKEGRLKWEEKFASKYIAPLLKVKVKMYMLSSSLFRCQTEDNLMVKICL